MEQDLLDILRGRARALLARRVIEAAVVAATAGSLCAAAAAAAWALAPLLPYVASILAAAPLLFGVAMLVLPGIGRRAGLDRTLAFVVAAFCIAVGAGAAGCIASGMYAGLPKAAIGAALVPLGALAGAVAAAVRGASAIEVALLIDRRARLDERMGTAAELASTGRDETPAAACLRDQAVAALRGRASRVSFWSRGRATVAAAGLAVVLCATVTLLPDLHRDPTGPLAGLTERRRQQLAARALRAATNERTDPAQAADLARLAQAVKALDESEFDRIVRRLKKAGFSVVDVLGAALAAGSGRSGGPGDGAGDNGGESGQNDGSHTASRPGLPAGGDVLAWSPTEIKGEPATARASVGPGRFVPFETTWAVARDRAADALRRGDLPPRHRRLVRDFFAGPRAR